MCYDRESGKIIDDRIYYLNYHEIKKAKSFQKKVIKGTIFYLIKWLVDVFFQCFHVENLHRKGKGYVILPNSVIINNYSGLRKTCLYRAGVHHGYASKYCKKHKEQLLKFFWHEVSVSTTEKCSCDSRGNCITVCKECFEFYQKKILCDVLKFV